MLNGRLEHIQSGWVTENSWLTRKSWSVREKWRFDNPRRKQENIESNLDHSAWIVISHCIILVIITKEHLFCASWICKYFGLLSTSCSLSLPSGIRWSRQCLGSCESGQGHGPSVTISEQQRFLSQSYMSILGKSTFIVFTPGHRLREPVVYYYWYQGRAKRVWWIWYKFLQVYPRNHTGHFCSHFIG